MEFGSGIRRLAACTIGGIVLLAGCASGPNKAPVEDRKPPRVAGAVPRAASAPPAAASAATAVAEAPKPATATPDATGRGFYTVKPGDTLARIALDSGQNWRDIARWNNIDNPNVIEVGQILRVMPPDAGVAAARPVTAPARVESRPLDARAAGVAASGASAPPAGASAPPAPPLPPPTAQAVLPPPIAPRDPDEDLPWIWPAAGNVVTTFDEARSNKGVAIAGRAGDPVYSAADGRVVYAGSGLRGYGNLVIVKHNATFLTAYAHNQTLLVKEDQVVRRGQKIAEMGSSDADRVQLHFEIRRLGKPVDPLKLLPPR